LPIGASKKIGNLRDTPEFRPRYGSAEDPPLVSDFGRCGTLNLGLTVATAALAGRIDIAEMWTLLLKTHRVANVVPAFRNRFPDALPRADMKIMDGGAGEARNVFGGGGNIFDFLALAHSLRRNLQTKSI
jgi:hypothetical protein